MRMLLGVAMAMAVAVAVTPAAALELKFKVDVTSVDDGSDFTPFSFVETWTSNPTYTVTPLGGGVVQQDLAGRATVDAPSAVTAAQGALAGLDTSGPAETDSRMHFIAPNTFFFGLRHDLSSSELISEGEKGTSDDVFLERFYARTVGLAIFGTETLTLGDISDEAQVRAFLTGRSLSWGEFAAYRTVVGEGPHYDGFTESRRYQGTATLLSSGAVPEPGTWALMIMGVGGAGAMLRRRAARLA